MTDTRADLALPLAQQAAEASEKLDAKSPETAKPAARVRLRSAFTSHARPLNCRQGVAQQVRLPAQTLRRPQAGCPGGEAAAMSRLTAATANCAWPVVPASAKRR